MFVSFDVYSSDVCIFDVYWSDVCIIRRLLVWCLYYSTFIGLMFVLFDVYWFDVCIIRRILVWYLYFSTFIGLIFVLFDVSWSNGCIILLFCVKYTIWYTICRNYCVKESSLCNKLWFSNIYIFSTWWCKPLIFQT